MDIWWLLHMVRPEFHPRCLIVLHDFVLGVKPLLRTVRRFNAILEAFISIGVLMYGFQPAKGGLFRADFTLLVLLVVSRFYVVAIKYGYMPPGDYAIIRKGHAIEAAEVQKRQQLLTGWMNPEAASMRLELTDAAARHRIDLDKHTFTISK